MVGAAGGGTAGASDATVVLSTGHEVHLPFALSATVTGAVFTASLGGLRELVPAGLRPVRVVPDRGGLVVAGVAYDRVGVEGLDPYDEVAVMIPVTEGHGLSASPLAVLPGLGRVGGYVWFLPVTTEPARALGAEVCAYPKAVGEITHERVPGGRRTTLRVDDQHVLTLTVDRPPTIPLPRWPSTRSYTERDGRLLREPIALSGRAGAWPLSRRATLELGDHPRARRLASLDPGDRALVRFAAELSGTIGPGVPVQTDETRPG